VKIYHVVCLLLYFVLLSIFGMAAGAAASDVTGYSSTALGFSMQLPTPWLPPKENPPATLIFSGQPGTDQYHTTINAQLVRDPQGSSLEAQSQEIEKQLATAPHFRLLSRQTGTLSGLRAVRLEVEYQEPNGSTLFRQEQFVCDRTPYFFWLGYTAPAHLFDAWHKIMANALETLQFVPLNGHLAPLPPPSSPPQGSGPDPGATALPPATPQPPVPISSRPAPSPPAGFDGPPSLDSAVGRLVFDVQTARGVSDTGPVGVARVFPPDVGRIHVWFRFRDLPAGTELRSEWFFGSPSAMHKVTEVTTQLDHDIQSWGQFSLHMQQGRTFPVGEYRVDIFRGPTKESSISFRVE